MAGPNPNYYARSGLLDFLTSDTSDDLTYRSSMLPIGTYRGDDGRERAGLAWPRLAMDAVDAMEAVSTLDPALYPEEAQRHAGTIAGLMMGGGLAAPRPGNALAMGGGRIVDDALPMDQASRMARAREMGFDTDTTWYHGTSHGDIEAFDLAKIAELQSRTNNGFDGVSISQSPKVASEYTGLKDKSAVYPLHIKAEKPFLWRVDDFESYRGYGPEPETLVRAREVMPTFQREGDFITEQRRDFSQALGKAGYDALDIEYQGKNLERVILNPRNIRSVNAAFDPAQADSANLLAANASPSTGLMSLYGYDDEYDPFLNY